MDGESLKKRREDLEMSQAQLAKTLEVDVTTISRWERGERSIPAYLKLALETVERQQKKGGKK
jgi:transcriptional regulator with XRE-family HTH domain